MRNDFTKQVNIEMKKNKNIIFLTGDLGFNALESIRTNFPDRFINVGVAEANMIGIAAGLALTGKKVITYSIAPFITLRAYEQIRNDICYQNLDVKVVGTGGGFNYSTHGLSHHSIEDLAIMSVMPNMEVFSPSYSWEAKESIRAMIKSKGPAYIRLGKNPALDYSKPDFKFVVGQGYIIKPGKDILLMITGNILDYGVTIANIIKEEVGLNICLVSMPSIKPIDEEWFLKVAKNMKMVATMEEHSLHGGLASKISMIFSQSGLNKKFLPFGIPDRFIKDVGNRDFLLKKSGLNPETVSKKIIQCLKNI